MGQVEREYVTEGSGSGGEECGEECGEEMCGSWELEVLRLQCAYIIMHVSE